MSHWTDELFVEHADLYAADLEASTDAAREQVGDLLDFLADEHDFAPDSALDVACGIGRHAVPLAERGLAVDGLDLSPAFLDRARERAADAGVTDRTRFVEGDVRELPDADHHDSSVADLREDYDLVTCFYTSFGFFDDATNREVLAAMADRVAHGGALVVEVTNKEGLLANFADSGVYEQDDYLVTEQREYHPETSRIETTRRTFETGDEDYEFAAETTFSLRLYAPVELRRLVADAGLDPHCYGGFEGSTLERESSRLVVVGRA